MDQNARSINGSRERGEKLSEVFNGLNKKKTKLEKTRELKGLTDEQEAELQEVATKLSTFNEKCKMFIRKRKNGPGKFHVDEYVRWCTNMHLEGFNEEKSNVATNNNFKPLENRSTLSNQFQPNRNNYRTSDTFSNFANGTQRNNDNFMNARIRSSYQDGDGFFRNPISSSVVINAKISQNVIDKPREQQNIDQGNDISNPFLKPGVINRQNNINAFQQDFNNQTSINQRNTRNDDLDISFDKIVPLSKSKDTRPHIGYNFGPHILSPNSQPTITTAARRVNNQQPFNLMPSIRNPSSPNNINNFSSQPNIQHGHYNHHNDERTKTETNNRFMFGETNLIEKSRDQVNRKHFAPETINKKPIFDTFDRPGASNIFESKNMFITKNGNTFEKTSLQSKVVNDTTGRFVGLNKISMPERENGRTFSNISRHDMPSIEARTNLISGNMKTHISLENNRILESSDVNRENMNVLRHKHSILKNETIFNAVLCHLDTILHKTMHIAQSLALERDDRVLRKSDISLALEKTDVLCLEPVTKSIVDLEDVIRDFSKHKKTMKMIDKYKNLDDIL